MCIDPKNMSIKQKQSIFTTEEGEVKYVPTTAKD